MGLNLGKTDAAINNLSVKYPDISRVLRIIRNDTKNILDTTVNNNKALTILNSNEKGSVEHKIRQAFAIEEIK